MSNPHPILILHATGSVVSIDIETGQSGLGTLQRLSDGPPRPRSAFDMTQKHWVYKVQSRRWVVFTDGREDWTDWHSLTVGTRPYYVRKSAADRALAMYQKTCPVFYFKRDFRVVAVEHPTGIAFRRAKGRWRARP